uniref:Si:ch211-140m22.7 n=1 Tax=Nothobranchius kuhntae TaxID=321403 RepID=A0A1A8IJ01_NOTKU
MATSLLRIGRLSHAKCLQAESWMTLSRIPPAAALSSKSGPKKPVSTANPDKKQPKTYFDIEKLVQHKPYKFPKKDISSPAASTTAAKAAVRAPVSSVTKPKIHAAAPAVVVSTSDVKTPTPVIEVTPTVNAVNEPASAAEAKPAVEAIPVAEGVLESKPVGSSDPVSEVAPTAESTKAVVEAVEDSSVETASFTVSDAESAIDPTLDTETKPTAEAAAKVPVEEIVEDLPKQALFGTLTSNTVEVAPGRVAPEPPTVEVGPVLVAEVAPAEMISEPTIKEAPEPVAEAALIVETALEDSIPEPVAKDASIEVTTELKAEAALEPMAEVEVALEPIAEAVPVEVITEPTDEAAPC